MRRQLHDGLLQGFEPEAQRVVLRKVRKYARERWTSLPSAFHAYGSSVERALN